MNLTETCVRKPVLAWMLMAATIVFGIVAGTRIGISQFPDVDFPTITVSVSWSGAAPEVIENDIVEMLEETLMQVEGIRTITSTSRMGGASVTLEVEMRLKSAAITDDPRLVWIWKKPSANGDHLHN